MSDLFVIDDATPISRIVHPDHAPSEGRGLELPPDAERSYAGVAQPFPSSLVIPRSEWQARIREKEERRATLRGFIRSSGIKVKDQARTNYCWINAPAWCVEIIRATQGQRHVELSPASAGAKIKNFRNVGGWGREGLEWIVDNGLAPVDLWPANAIDRRYDTPAAAAAAIDYRVDEWWFLENRDLDQLVSALLLGFPVAVGYNWWGHEVTAVDAVWLDGSIAVAIGNSWSEAWGDEGYGVLQGSRMLPDDAVVPRTAVAC